MKDNNRRFKIHMDNYRPSKGASILYLVDGRRFGTQHPTSIELVMSLSSRHYYLDHLGANKSFNVRMLAINELENSTDAIDHLIHTLRNDKNTYVSLTPAALSTYIDRRISEKFVIKEIEEGVI